MSDTNKLWVGHRFILPEMREKAVNRCGDCRFFVRIKGVQEIRQGCVASVGCFRRLWKLVPEQIPLAEVLCVAGRKGLPDILAHSNPEAQACGEFLPRLKTGNR